MMGNCRQGEEKQPIILFSPRDSPTGYNVAWCYYAAFFLHYVPLFYFSLSSPFRMEARIRKNDILREGELQKRRGRSKLDKAILRAQSKTRSRNRLLVSNSSRLKQVNKRAFIY